MSSFYYNDTKPHIPSKATYDFASAGKNGTLVVVVLDESGSMYGIRDSTISAFNTFLSGQREADVKNAGQAFLSLILFDAPHIKTIYKAKPIKHVPLLNRETYDPDGGTNLNDAIATALSQVNSYLVSIQEHARPGVLILIMTDGQENQSVHFTTKEIRDMVAVAETADWTFTFLGANIDAFATGEQYGMAHHNTMHYSTHKMTATMTSLSASVTNTRTMKTAGARTRDIYEAGIFTDAQRKDSM